MNSIFICDINDYITVLEIAKELGREPGSSIEDIFLAYMEIKNIKPSSFTELNKTELLAEIASHGKKVLNIETAPDGKQTLSIVKKDDNIQK
jgi:hypothetical protein